MSTIINAAACRTTSGKPGREKSRMIDIVVTRHPALVEYLQEKGLVGEDVEVLSHVSDPENELRGKIVAGVLPLHLAAHCVAVIEVPLNLTPEDRGKELSLERVREIAGPARAWSVASAVDAAWAWEGAGCPSQKLWEAASLVGDPKAGPA